MDNKEMSTDDCIEVMQADAERHVFASLIQELELRVPEFSGREIRERALSALDGFGDKFGPDGEKWARAVTDRVIWDMIPRSIYDDEPHAPAR